MRLRWLAPPAGLRLRCLGCLLPWHAVTLLRRSAHRSPCLSAGCACTDRHNSTLVYGSATSLPTEKIASFPPVLSAPCFHSFKIALYFDVWNLYLQSHCLCLVSSYIFILPCFASISTVPVCVSIFYTDILPLFWMSTYFFRSCLYLLYTPSFLAFMSSPEMPEIPKPGFKAPPAALARRPSPQMPATSTPAVETPPPAVTHRVYRSAVEEWFHLPPPGPTEGLLPKAPPNAPPLAAVPSSPKPPPPQLPDDFDDDADDHTLSAAHLPLPQFLKASAATRASTETSPLPLTPTSVTPPLPPGPVTPPVKSAYGSHSLPASPPFTAPLSCAAAPMDPPQASVPVVHAWDAVTPTPAEQPALSTPHASPPAAAARGPPPALPPQYVTRHSPSFSHKPPRKEMRALLQRKTVEINAWHRDNPAAPYWEQIPNTETSPWVHYLTTLPAARKDIVFENDVIASFGVASFVDELDPNTGFPRVDFQAWRSDGVSHIRLHPGSTTSNDAEPLYNSTGLAVDARRNYTAKRRGETLPRREV